MAQTKLQMALLNLGQFQSAIDDVLSWLDKTENMLDEAGAVAGDPRLVEIELAKIRVSHDTCARNMSTIVRMASF